MTWERIILDTALQVVEKLEAESNIYVEHLGNQMEAVERKIEEVEGVQHDCDAKNNQLESELSQLDV